LTDYFLVNKSNEKKNIEKDMTKSVATQA